jgi:hypothetical protein
MKISILSSGTEKRSVCADAIAGTTSKIKNSTRALPNMDHLENSRFDQTLSGKAD